MKELNGLLNLLQSIITDADTCIYTNVKDNTRFNPLNTSLTIMSGYRVGSSLLRS